MLAILPLVNLLLLESHIRNLYFRYQALSFPSIFKNHTLCPMPTISPNMHIFSLNFFILFQSFISFWTYLSIQDHIGYIEISVIECLVDIGREGGKGAKKIELLIHIMMEKLHCLEMICLHFILLLHTVYLPMAQTYLRAPHHSALHIQ